MRKYDMWYPWYTFTPLHLEKMQVVSQKDFSMDAIKAVIAILLEYGFIIAAVLVGLIWFKVRKKYDRENRNR